ncbi:MAG: sulfatase [Myxococcota bacterium]|nr:sulfatase [Myxococcota bacterium]
MEVQLATRSRLTVKIATGPKKRPDSLPAQFVTVLWNDEELGTLPADGGSIPIRFSVPKAAQRLGLNRLVLMPHYWFDPTQQAQQLNETARGLQIESIEFVGKSSAQDDLAPAAVVEDDIINQKAGTVITHYAVLPDDARLTGRFVTGSPDSHGSIVLALDGEVETTLFRTEAALEAAADTTDPGAERGFDIDLAAFAGRAAGLSFIVAGSTAESHSTWVSPVLHGTRGVEHGEGDEHQPKPTLETKRPNILLVLFDTLRADATEPYGAPEGSTPSIARLGRAGTVFAKAYATGATTRVSVASMLTGHYPPRHGVTEEEHRLARTLPYLPDLLEEDGYTTVGVIDNPQLSADRGFDRGFDTFEELFRIDENDLRRDHPEPRKRAKWTWESFVAPALSTRGDKPFFVYLHELDPHFPYQPLPPYDVGEDDAYRGVPLMQPERMHWLVRFDLTRKILALINENRNWLDEASLRALRRRYAGEVAYMDAYLGWILDHLDETGLRDDTVVVFVSDHGEEFLEHDHFGHSLQVYDPAIRVPLIISRPDGVGRGSIVEAPAELLDLPSTLLGLAGADVPEQAEGRDLFGRAALAPDRAALRVRPTLAYGDWKQPATDKNGSLASRQVSIRVGDSKLIRNRYQTAGEAFDTYELYDLAADPDESTNLWFSRPVLGHTLRQQLDARNIADARATESFAPEVEPLGEDMRNRLRALGYAE